MTFSMGSIISMSLIGVACVVMITARHWPFRTALFPFVIGIPVFILALLEFFLGLFDKDDAIRPGEASEGIDPRVASRRALSMIAWIFGFFALIILAGFPLAAPLLVFLYLKFQSREGWALSLILTGCMVLFFYGLFVWLLHTPFAEGWLFRWLETLGTG